MIDEPATDWAAWSRESVQLMKERNQSWPDRLGVAVDAPYRWDLDAGTLRFERSLGQLVARICLVGTASECEGTFLWSWANESIPEAAKRGLQGVHQFGTDHSLSLLTTPEFPGGRPEGLEMLAIAGRLLDAEGIFIDRSGDVTLFFALLGFSEANQGPG
jgi:hypothetical protein